MKKQVAIIGIQGVPARYGGFETLVENIIGENCSKEIDYTIFCSQKEMTEKLDTYKGCKLKYVNLKSNGISSIPYDIISMIKSIRGFDSILVLGTSGCIFTPILKLLSKSKLIINIDGLEHRRGKWNKFAKKYLRFSEYMAVKFADVIISDNKAIQEYVREVYGKDSVMIPYGGNHVARKISNEENTKVLLNYGLEAQNYSISICRIEPENNCHSILEAFSQSESKLVFIGNWNHSEYSKQLKKKYSTCENIKIITSSRAAVDVATLHKCKAIVRGLRGLTDFDYEIGMAGINKDISDGRINTVCLFADNNYQNISSSMVKEVFNLGKPISKYVSPIVENAMNEKYIIEETSTGKILTLRRKDN